MPQMKPIFWLNLYILFTLIILVYLILNFYNSLFISLNKKILNCPNTMMSWKW